MPTPSTAKLAKPKSEDEFEDICVDALRVRWKDSYATRNGRRGQRQDGVDIVGGPSWLKGKKAGAQCKNTDSLKLKEIVAEVTKATSFKGGLGEFLILTSGDRDASLQAEVRAHFKANPAPFDVELLFWPDITSDISQDEMLVAKHWKGFPSVPAGGSPDAWPSAPAWIDRANVDASEIVECQCELALQTPGFSDVSASELATAIQNLARNRPATAGIEIELMMRSAPTRSATFTWRENHRDHSNVIRKWELEIGDSGFLAFRWSKFTTTSNHRQAMLEILPLLDGVIVPLRLHRLAIETRSPTPPATLRVRLSCHAEPGPLLLHDDARATLPFPRFSMPEGSPTWSESLDAKWERSSRNVARRTIDRGLSNFTAVPRTPNFDGSVTFVTVNEDVISKIGGADL